MVDRIWDYPKIRLLVQSSSKLPPIIRVHDVEAGLIDVAVEYEAYMANVFIVKRRATLLRNALGRSMVMGGWERTKGR